ncbi:MAG: hypothetical protein FWH37_01260 [Candidatus Bathyarchaeota archaeon]|nr:hypothetical protein [Candidatus Termiticorpusculum sp.]
MDENQVNLEEIDTELIREITTNTVYTIICLYHLKPTKKVTKYYKHLPPKVREQLEKMAINKKLFERTNNTIEITTKGIDFLLDNIIKHVEVMMAFTLMLKEMNETYNDDDDEHYDDDGDEHYDDDDGDEHYDDDDDDEHYDDDDNYIEIETNKENKTHNKNTKRQDKRKQKRQQNPNKT